MDGFAWDRGETKPFRENVNENRMIKTIQIRRKIKCILEFWYTMGT